MSRFLSRFSNAFFAFLFAVLSINLTGVLSLQNAYATQNNDDNITICHSTQPKPSNGEGQGPTGNPYNQITVDISSLNGQEGNDHTSHTGVADGETTHVYRPGDLSWGDIIPAYPAGSYQHGNTTITYPAYEGLNWDTAGQAIYNNGCAVPEIEVTATAPTQAESCGTENDTYTIIATEGVVYKVDGTETAAGTYPGTGSVTITAEAAEGFVLTGDDSWTFEFDATACPTEVRATAPTFTEVCSTENDTFTIPSTEGVIYMVKYFPGKWQVLDARTYDGYGKVRVKAIALDGFELKGKKNWTHTFTNETCPPELVDPIPVTEYEDVCTPEDDYYVIPEQTGVVYKVNDVVVSAGTHYTTAESVTVTAEVEEGYYFPEEAQTSWTFEFTNEGCPEPVLSASGVCSLTGVLVTITNDGDVDGTVYVSDGYNEVELNVPANDSVEYTVPFTIFKASVFVYDLGENVYLDQDFDCTPGKGNITPPVVTPPQTTPETPSETVTELPETGANPFVQMLTLLIAGVSTYAIMFYAVNRRELQ